MTQERVFLKRRQADETQSVEAILKQQVRDLTDRVQALEAENRELREHALVDPLTGLGNRRAMALITEKEVSNAMRDGRDTAVFAIDLDDFKRINDLMGHAAGDKVLVEAAKRITEAVRLGDYVFRPGGDEFVVIAIGVNSSTARELSKRIVEKLGVIGPIIPGQLEAGIRASIGHALYSESNNVKTLLESADLNMYSDKSAVKNRLRV